MRVAGILTVEADRSLLRLTLYLLSPCLIVDTLLDNQVATEAFHLVVAPLMGFATAGLGYAVALAAGRAMGLDDRARRTFSFGVGLYNYGFIPVPLVLSLFDRATLGVLFLFNVGVEISIWTVGVVILSGGSLVHSWKQIFMPPVVAVGVGVVLSATGMGALLPTPALRVFDALGACAIPLALVLTGAVIFDYRREFDPSTGLGVTMAGVGLRMAVLPALFMVLAMAPLGTEMRRVLVVQAAMPAAMLPIVLARLHSGDVALSLRLTLMTTIVSLFTIPFVIDAGLKWLELAP